jgi:hypothetical protein
VQVLHAFSVFLARARAENATPGAGGGVLLDVDHGQVLQLQL